MTLLHVYVLWRLDSLPLRKKHVPRRVLVGIGVGGWLLFYLGRVFGSYQGGFCARALDLAAMHWMAVLFLLATCLFIADLATGFGLWARKQAPRVRTVAAAVGIGLGLLAHVQGFRPPVIEHHEVAVPSLPAELDGTTILAMADLHVGEAIGTGWVAKRVEEIQALEPDMIVLVGDIFERSSVPYELIPIIARLEAPLGIWAVRGNHDRLRSNRPDVFGEILAGARARILTNEAVEAAPGLVVAGIDDLTSSRRRPGEGERNLDTALLDRPAGATILLSHTPWLTDRAAAGGVALMLSGHTHGGQIWPFSYLVRSRYRYVTGPYDIAGMTLIVTRGAGVWGPRMRLWSPGDMLLITLRSEETGQADAAE